MFYFSKTTMGFFHSAAHGARMVLVDGEEQPNPDTKIPDDAVEIPEALHVEIVAGLAQGRTLEVGEDGMPFLGPVPEATPEQLLGILRAQRSYRLAQSDWTQMPDVKMSDEKRAAWSKYRQDLRDLPSKQQDPNEVTWPEEP